MTNTSKTIVFFGSGPVAAKSLDYIASNFDVEIVITKSKPLHHKHNAPVEELAKKLGLKILFANDKNSLDQIIDSTIINSRLGIIIDFGIIVSKKVIEKFEYGIINSHFSLLPEWRGADPITYSILSGQKHTGVSLMLIDEGMDTGKLLAQEKVEIENFETSISLTEKLVRKSNQMLTFFIPKYINGSIKPFIQPKDVNPSYSKKLTKQDSIIDQTKSSEQLEREIRAFQGWPGSKFTLKDKEIKIKKAHTSNKKETEIDIFCSDGKYLVIDELIAPSGKTMSSVAFINGYLS
jgi:methionyl-tRNA formyltransferase